MPELRQPSRSEESQPIYFDNAFNHRNRPGRSGLDIMDSYREAWYVTGYLLRKLVQRKIGVDNPFYVALVIYFVIAMISRLWRDLVAPISWVLAWNSFR